jgi:hypothetical protein
MTLNATTGIDPEVDRFAIYRESTSEYINTNANWPRVDGGPIEGGNPDYKYYKRTTSERPDVDHRYTVATTWDKVETSPAPPEGHPAGEYLQSHVATKLPVEDLKLQVEAEFQRQQKLIYPDIDNPAVLLEGAGALIQKSNSAPLTTDEQAKLTLLTGVANGLKQLRARQAELNDAIDADEDYDITEGWTIV